MPYKLDPKKKTNYKPELIGWVGFCCSYSGKYFGGYAGDYPESRRLKNGTLPNYQQEAINSTAKQIPKLKGVEFTNKNYWELEIPKDLNKNRVLIHVRAMNGKSVNSLFISK